MSEEKVSSRQNLMGINISSQNRLCTRLTCSPGANHNVGSASRDHAQVNTSALLVSRGLQIHGSTLDMAAATVWNSDNHRLKLSHMWSSLP